MRRLQCALLAAVAVIGFASIASAADMPTKAPAAIAPYNWTGFYVGGHGGIGWGLTPDQRMLTTVIGDIDPLAFGGSRTSFGTGGLQGGYNWQFNPNFVLGLEGDFSWGSFGRTNTVGPPVLTFGAPNPCCSVLMTNKARWLASARGRIGYAMQKSLIYVTGGAAWMRVDYSGTNTYNAPFIGTSSFSSTKSGWVLGGGIEYNVIANLLLRAEYLYYDFGGATSTVPVLPAPGGGVGPITYTWGNSNVQVLRAGLSVKF